MENKNQNFENDEESIQETEMQNIGLLQEDLNQAIKEGDAEEIEFCEKELGEAEVNAMLRKMQKAKEEDN